VQKFDLSPFIAIHSFSDLDKYPDFRQGIKLTEDLKHSARIVAPYKIGPDFIPCGLTCHQGHLRGYVVCLADGSHTNVGKDCGSNYFGASNFDLQVKEIEAKERDEDYKKRINELIDLIPSYRKKTINLWHKSTPLYNALKNFKAAYPERIFEDLRNRGQRRQTAVTVTRKRDTTEQMSTSAEMYVNQQGEKAKGSTQSQYIQETIGELRGLSIFVVKPRSCLKIANDLIAEIEAFDNTHISRTSLSKYARYKSDIEAKIREAEEILTDGKKFFSENNFQLLPHLCERSQYKIIQRIVWDFDAGEAKILSDGQLKRIKQKEAS
jgi:hypothetical protein